jgi:acetylornithine deacetylase/succinyl-diaminopimelate desuccinylase-like protein
MDLDKWTIGGPYKPVIKDEKLYGRGGADDGYAIYSIITAIKSLQLQKLDHARYVVIIEACEESGSPDLLYYVDMLEKKIGNPNFIICLDSGCLNYDQLWVTTSLRGIVMGKLNVSVLSEGLHSVK